MLENVLQHLLELIFLTENVELICEKIVNVKKENETTNFVHFVELQLVDPRVRPRRLRYIYGYVVLSELRHLLMGVLYKNFYLITKFLILK